MILKKLFFATFVLGCFAFAKAQSIKAALEKYNQHSVPYITVEELREGYESYMILDTRKQEEYNVSHLPGAIFVGDKHSLRDFLIKNPNRTNPIVVYCSIGVRSEDAGETMDNFGFKNVKNLYGGIFMWKDAGYRIVNITNQQTDTVHVYSKEWSRYLKTGKKVY